MERQPIAGELDQAGMWRLSYGRLWRLLLNHVGALRFALAEGDVFARDLEQVDEDIIGRDTCRGR